jgi:probable blue pigment (indigoidine) exporter
MRQILPGIIFAMLWASAAVATKIGITASHPLVLANIRFFIAGILVLLFAYVIQGAKNRLPKGVEWRNLLIFSLLNTTIYLGAYVTAMKEVSAGIGSLSTATSPLFILLMSAVWMRRKLRWQEIAGIAMGFCGVAMATWPLLQDAHTTIKGLLILLGGMVSVSIATVFYARVKWELSSVVINGWQVLMGGLCLLPLTLFTADLHATQWTLTFWGPVFWLILPVSIISMQLWFHLIRIDAVKASIWLFLCPIFGFVYSHFLLGEPLTAFTFAGTALVIAGLYLAQRKKEEIN